MIPQQRVWVWILVREQILHAAWRERKRKREKDRKREKERKRERWGERRGREGGRKKESEVEGGNLVGLSPNLCHLMLSPGRQRQNWMKFHVGQPVGVTDLLDVGWWGRAPHICVRSAVSMTEVWEQRKHTGEMCFPCTILKRQDIGRRLASLTVSRGREGRRSC